MAFALRGWTPAGRFLGGAFILLLWIVLIYVQSAGFDFVDFDDNQFVFGNPYLKEGITPRTLGWAFTANLTGFSGHAEYWSPLTLLTRLLDATLFGIQPGAMHLTSMWWHAANTLLLFFILWRMTGALAPAWLAAALFAVHPMHAEPVLWLSARKDLVSTFFFFATIGVYGRYATGRSWLRYAALLATFLLAMMSKPMVVTVPFVLLLIDWWPLRRYSTTGIAGFLRSAVPLVLEKIPLFLLSGVGAWLAFHAQKNWLAVHSLAELTLGERLGNALVAYSRYLQLTFWPADLSFFYRLRSDLLTPLNIAAAILLLGTIAGLSLWQARKRPYLIVGYLWFLGVLVPVIGLVQISQQAMADRYSYVPHAGLFIALSWLVWEATRRLRRTGAIAAACAIGVVLSAYAGAAAVQAGTWKNSETLFKQALKADPDNDVAHMLLGSHYSNRWERGSSLWHYQECLRINPSQIQAYKGLADWAESDGNAAEAIRLYSIAMTIEPNYPAAHGGLAALYLKQGNLDLAGRHYLKVIELMPDHVASYLGLAKVLDQSGFPDRAISILQHAHRIAPHNAAVKTELERLEKQQQG